MRRIVVAFIMLFIVALAGQAGSANAAPCTPADNPLPTQVPPLARNFYPSDACAPIVFSGPGGQFATYTQPVAFAQVDGDLTHVNVDIAQHDVRSLDVRAPEDRPAWCGNLTPCPLFTSELVGAGKTSRVRGLDGIEAGKTYEFTCSIHPNMFGTLVALPKAP